MKLKNGELESGFTILEEENEVTRQFVLPGSAANKIGAPHDVQIYVLYKVTDNHTGTRIWSVAVPGAGGGRDHGGFVERTRVDRVRGCIRRTTLTATSSRSSPGATAVSDYLVTFGPARLVISPHLLGARRLPGSPTTPLLRRFSCAGRPR